MRSSVLDPALLFRAVAWARSPFTLGGAAGDACYVPTDFLRSWTIAPSKTTLAPERSVTNARVAPGQLEFRVHRKACSAGTAHIPEFHGPTFPVSADAGFAGAGPSYRAYAKNSFDNAGSFLLPSEKEPERRTCLSAIP